MRKEKIYEILFFLILFLIILSTILLKPLDDLDEIWNYNFARNIATGLIPYKDFNIVVTPLLSIICGIILRITFNQLFVMRILAALLCSAIIYITYKLFNVLNIKKEVSIIFTFFIGYLFNDILCIDYNYGSLLLVLIIIYLEIQEYKKDNIFIKLNTKKDILLGILAGLAILTKQTSGLLISIVVLGNKLLFIRNKKEFKLYLKSFLYRLIGLLIPVCVFLIYLLINNAFWDFINYTIMGIADFKNTIEYKTLIKFDLLGVISILVPITFVYAWVKSIVLEKDRKEYVLLVYGLSIFVICFPISNKIHFLIGALPTIIILLYELYNLYNLIKKKVKILNKERINEFILLTINYIIILFIIYDFSINIYNYIIQKDNFSVLKHYKNIIISENLEGEILNINQYIKNNGDVKILDSSAGVYMIPLDRTNKDYDMLNKGNLGFNGEERIINEISNSKNIKYLILKDEFPRNWQTPMKVINYVKENKTKVGEIAIYNVYE